MNDDVRRILHAKQLIRQYGDPIRFTDQSNQHRANALCCYRTKRIV